MGKKPSMIGGGGPGGLMAALAAGAQKKARQRMESNASSISGFGSDDDDDPFGVNNSEKIEKPVENPEEKPVVEEKPVGRGNSLFGDSDEDEVDYTVGMDTNDDDLLDSKPEQTVTEQVEEEKPTVVKSSGSGLFSDGSDGDGDDMFGTSTNAKAKTDSKPLASKGLFSDDDDDDDDNMDFGSGKATTTKK